MTSQTGFGRAMGFTAKKIRRRQFNHLLWNSTLMMKHYRSNYSLSTGILTPANTSGMTVFRSAALHPDVNNFWELAGGGVDPDVAGSMPTFGATPFPDFVIRGGKIGIRLGNVHGIATTNENSLMGVVFLVKTGENFQAGSIPATVPVGWDTSLIPDFKTAVGRIIMRRNFLLNDGNAAIIEFKLPIMKLNGDDFLGNRNAYQWIILVGNVETAVAATMNLTQYHNISFTGDVV